MNLVGESGAAVNITASTQITPTGKHAVLLGFYVNSTSSGTIVFRNGGSGSAGVVLSGTITPAVGFHRFPADCPNGIHATIASTLDVTIFYQAG